jgi:ADP-heptose:LPS heptosyltransferase
MDILLSFFHGIGDAIMFIPALRMYKQENPRAKIGILCQKETKEIFGLCPYVDEIFISLNKHPRYGILPLFLMDRFKIQKEAKKIQKKKNYDQRRFVLPHGINSYIPIPGKLLSRFPFLYNLDKNEIKKFCKILRVCKNKNWEKDFYTEVFTNPSEEEKAKKFLNKINGKKVIVHLGSTSGRRGFNKIEKKEIVDLLIKNNFKIILLFEKSIKKEVISCYPKSISFSIGLIKNCDLFLGPDSGPANIAAALKTPSIIISKIIPPNLRFLKRKDLLTFYKYDQKEISDAIKNIN